MTNYINHGETMEQTYLLAHEVTQRQFLDRVQFFEHKYTDVFPNGWRDFLVAYTVGQTDEENLDYDEWAFLCEQFARELTEPWRPPGSCADSQEKPETTSGFSFGGVTDCLIRRITSSAWTARSLIAKGGWISLGRVQRTRGSNLIDSSNGK